MCLIDHSLFFLQNHSIPTRLFLAVMQSSASEATPRLASPAAGPPSPMTATAVPPYRPSTSHPHPPNGLPCSGYKGPRLRVVASQCHSLTPLSLPPPGVLSPRALLGRSRTHTRTLVVVSRFIRSAQPKSQRERRQRGPQGMLSQISGEMLVHQALVRVLEPSAEAAARRLPYLWILRRSTGSPRRPPAAWRRAQRRRKRLPRRLRRGSTTLLC